MSARKTHKLLSVLIGLTLVLGVFAPIFGALAESDSVTESNERLRGTFDGGYIGPGETEYLNGTELDEFLIDDSIIIDGGRLEINNTTLTLMIDGYNPYNITLKNGGELSLWNSEINTRYTGQYRPFLKTNISAIGNSNIELREGSSFGFPGWVYLEDSNLTMEDSSFDALEDIPNYDYTWGYDPNVAEPDNEYGPTLTATRGSNITLIDSEINDNYRADLDSMEWKPRDWTGDYEVEEEDIRLVGGEDHYLDITSWVLNNPQFPTPGGVEEYPYMNPFNRISALFLDLEFIEYSDDGDVEGSISYGIDGAEEQIFEITRDEDQYEGNLFDLDRFGSEIEELGYEGDDFTKDLFVRIENTGTANITVEIDETHLYSAYDNDMRIEDSTMTVINSYIDVDHEPADVDPRDDTSQPTAPETQRVNSDLDHRAIRLYDSEFRAYGIEVEGESTPDGDPPFVEWGESNSEIYRWANVTALDETGLPVEGATIEANVSGIDSENNTKAFEYLEENYGGKYLGDGAYETDEKGKATMILRSNTLNFPEEWPNADFEGIYTLEGSYEENTTSKQISLASFPNLSPDANNPEYELNFTMRLPFPDLKIVDLTVDGETEPEDLVVNRSVEINLTVSNDGDDSAENVTVEFRLDGEIIDDNWSHEINLTADEEKSITFDWTPEEDHIGTKTLSAEIDPDDEIEERDKEDQYISVDLTINERPNLTIEEIILEGNFAEGGEVKVGEEVEVSAMVSNRGGTPAEDVEFIIFDHDGDTLGRDSLDYLADGDAVETESFTWDVPDDPGEYTLAAEVDPENHIDESDETNNYQERVVEAVSGPDIRIESFDVSFEPREGEEDIVWVGDDVTIEVTVENAGEWESNEVEVDFYLDQDEPTEEILDTVLVDRLPGGETETESLVWSAEIHELFDGEHLQDREITVEVREVGEDESDISEPFSLTVKRYVELDITEVSIEPPEVIEDETVHINATVENTGDFRVEQFTLSLYLDGAPLDNETYEESLPVGEDITLEFEWEAELDDEEPEEGEEWRYLRLEITETQPELSVEAPVEERPVQVLPRPYLEFVSTRWLVEGEETDPDNMELEEMDTLRFEGSVTNVGGTTAYDAVFEYRFPDDTGDAETIEEVPVGEIEEVYVEWDVKVTEDRVISIRLNSTEDPDEAITYDNETLENYTVEALTAELTDEPFVPEDPRPGESIPFEGTFRRASDGKPLRDVEVRVFIEDEDGNVVEEGTYPGTDDEGNFLVSLTLPDEEGDYTVVYEAQTADPQRITASMHVESEALEVAGMPWWLLLVIVAIAAGGVGSAFAYFKFFGVGEMVECGNCGATISADATSCPKCGVEFDLDTVKCSECGEWIPADLDVCPECGVEFVKTGKEVEDYTERMRKQYKKFIRKKKREAQEELGKELSQREFMDWWKDSPSFVTFEEWLERKEKQRREGSQECPECGTLNSVDDAVCQKCGTSLIDLGEREEDEEVFLDEEPPEEEEPLEEEEMSEPLEEEPAEGEEMPEPPEEEETLESEEGAEESDESEEGEKKVKKKPKKVKKKVVKKPDEDED